MSVLLTAALAYAADGIPILPLHTPTSRASCSCGRAGCDRPGKHPRWHRGLLPSGLHSASTDPTQIRRWWARWPVANIGLRTGVILDVCDVDGAEGVDALHELLGDAAVTGPVARTGSGGWHIYVAATGRGNRVRLLPGVDWRGTDGYVVAPPSLHVSGVRYRWTRGLAVGLPRCPDVLHALLVEQRSAIAQPAIGPVRNATRYAEAALAGEGERVAAAPPGQRNNTLYRAARSLGQLVAEGMLHEQDVVSVLGHAARRAGLARLEISRTIRSGLAAGRRRPRRRRAA